EPRGIAVVLWISCYGEVICQGIFPSPSPDFWLPRTAAIALPITAFLAWWLYVVTRAGNGQGLKWDKVPQNVNFAVSIVGTLYLIFVIIALIVLYFTRIRGGSEPATTLMLPALLRFALVFVFAIAAGSTFGEMFVLADERAFLKETDKFMATAKREPITGDMPMYSRQRWWPGSTNSMNSPMPKPFYSAPRGN
ncbi:MAG: hypothetical protein ABI852_08835, partial [Gemmatimonadaceae bacterium]